MIRTQKFRLPISALLSMLLLGILKDETWPTSKLATFLTAQYPLATPLVTLLRSVAAQAHAVLFLMFA